MNFCLSLVNTESKPIGGVGAGDKSVRGERFSTQPYPPSTMPEGLGETGATDGAGPGPMEHVHGLLVQVPPEHAVTAQDVGQGGAG